MAAEFLAPARENEFAGVQGRARGCTFVLRVSESRQERTPTLQLTVRHYSKQTTLRLDAPGCVVPDLDPALLRDAIEQECHRFATGT